jgi:hypothetical protein
MTLKSFILIGKDQTPQEVKVDVTYDLEALKINVADIFNIANHSGKHYTLRHFLCYKSDFVKASPFKQRKRAFLMMYRQSTKHLS